MNVNYLTKKDIKIKRTRKNYSPEFKAKVVLKLLQENKTINEIASKYSILPINKKIRKSNRREIGCRES
jgi:transposase-like protein